MSYGPWSHKESKHYLFILGCTEVFAASRAFSCWGEQRLHSSCGAWASHCRGFSCGAQALGLQASAVADMGSVVVVYRLYVLGLQ